MDIQTPFPITAGEAKPDTETFRTLANAAAAWHRLRTTGSYGAYFGGIWLIMIALRIGFSTEPLPAVAFVILALAAATVLVGAILTLSPNFHLVVVEAIAIVGLICSLVLALVTAGDGAFFWSMLGITVPLLLEMAVVVHGWRGACEDFQWAAERGLLKDAAAFLKGIAKSDSETDSRAVRFYEKGRFKQKREWRGVLFDELAVFASTDVRLAMVAARGKISIDVNRQGNPRENVRLRVGRAELSAFMNAATRTRLNEWNEGRLVSAK